MPQWTGWKGLAHPLLEPPLEKSGGGGHLPGRGPATRQIYLPKALSMSMSSGKIFSQLKGWDIVSGSSHYPGPLRTQDVPSSNLLLTACLVGTGKITCQKMRTECYSGIWRTASLSALPLWLVFMSGQDWIIWKCWSCLMSSSDVFSASGGLSLLGLSLSPTILALWKVLNLAISLTQAVALRSWQG